ncbi:SPW repeat domain-containing protein [Streptomyces sudanensis]|uniref:SPW repeat domain-containing protein n=1 Tax=Streptomyces sudanensis TaxID=436397 RepID=UPI0020CC1BFC|nr:SPW repeat protein [Streptomyces sudanensis]MCP9956353.1 SPW repeat protein [Streptomyces sudanensis]MCP9985559.1 SPW repeat protein [Streptomyces sudanensis]MCQ0003030.1 SPW repeat protein [Streptomyces sudanensis]
MVARTMSRAGGSPAPEERRVLREGMRDQIVSLLLVLTAVALFVAPWVTGEPDTAKDAHRNELAVGMVVLFVAMARFRWHLGRWADLVVLTAGAWLVASPWLLGLRNTVVFADGAHVFDVAAGSVLIVLSVVSLLLYRAAARDDRGSGRHRRD